jgi:hypothetical protein
MLVECEDICALTDAFCHRALPAKIIDEFTGHLSSCRVGTCRAAIDNYQQGLNARLNRLWWTLASREVDELEGGVEVGDDDFQDRLHSTIVSLLKSAA